MYRVLHESCTTQSLFNLRRAAEISHLPENVSESNISFHDHHQGYKDMRDRAIPAASRVAFEYGFEIKVGGSSGMVPESL